MAEPKTGHMKSMVEMSRCWEAHDLLRNLEDELQRLEQGMGHMIWDNESKPVTMCPCLLPMSPRFEISETEDEFSVKVHLPEVREEDIDVNIEKGSVEVFARQQEKAFRPFLLSIDAHVALDPESLRLESHDDFLVLRVRKLKKHRVKVK